MSSPATLVQECLPRPTRRPPPLTERQDVAKSLVPGLVFLTGEARRAGLPEVADIISQALTGVLRWIEDDHNDPSLAEFPR